MFNTYKCVAAALTLAVAAGAFAQEGYEFKDGKWVKSTPPVPGTQAGDLSLIRKLVADKDSAKAVKQAEKFLADYPESKHREEVLNLAGQAEFDREHYYQAYEWYEQQLGAFPNGAYFDRALKREYGIAQKFLGGKKRIALKIFRLPAQEEGLDILAGIAGHAPQTALARKSLITIGDYHYGKGDYADASTAYDHFLKLYPRSDQASYAMLQAARSAYHSFRGVAYDETPLLDAEQRFRLFSGRFPIQAEKAGVPGTLKRIALLRAEKLFKTAEFYDRTHSTGPANRYYKQVLEEYPQTAWGARALAVLKERGEAPADVKAPATKPAGENEGKDQL